MPIVSCFPGGGGSSSGGGISLGPVTGIDTVAAHNKVYIKWSDPADIVIDEIPLAKWAGTVLVRKEGSYPKNYRDGTTVIDNTNRDTYKTNFYCDEPVADGKTYYYKLFPYTDTGVYTNSTECQFTVSPKLVTVGNVSDLRIVSSGNGNVTITWKDPDDVSEKGVVTGKWVRTTVVATENAYATSPSQEGVKFTYKSEVKNAHASAPLTVSGLTNGNLTYIKLFPETTDGAITNADANGITGTPNKTVISKVPTQEGTLTYTGDAQQPKWKDYVEGQLTISGDTSKVDAGSYVAHFTPTDDYMWESGGSEPKDATWVIEKAENEISFTPESVTLNLEQTSQVITVNRKGDGAVTATPQGDLVTTQVNDNTITVASKGQQSGSTTIDVSVADSQNYKAGSKSLSVSASFIEEVLNDNAWAAISSAAQSGQAKNYWAVGDCKQIHIGGTVGTLSVNTDLCVYILGFDHNSAVEGKGVTFGTFKTAPKSGKDVCLVDSKYGSSSSSGKYFNMNHTSNTNAGGWKSCDLRYDVLGSTDTSKGDATSATVTSPVSGTLMAALPIDLRAVMKPITKYTDNVGNGGGHTAGNVTATVDYLPLLAEFEIFGSNSYANNQEAPKQQQYQYFIASNSKVKYRHSSQSDTAYWWERSPRYYNSSSFCIVDTNGDANDDNAYGSSGLAPAFLV